MIDLIVYDGNSQPIGILDNYISLIWAVRYAKVGDCEVEVPATAENIQLLQYGNFIGRNDDDMICRIMKIEINTDAERGDTLIATGYDAKCLLDQRIIWNTATCNGNVETFIRQLVTDNCCTAGDRLITKQNGNQLLSLGDSAGFLNVCDEQVSYKNLGEKIREYCALYGWGYKVYRKLYYSTSLYFELFEGTNRSSSVRFSPSLDNLASSRYVYDEYGKGNVALVGGEGEGSAREKQTFGTTTGIDRVEQFVDAKDISKTVSWKDLTAVFPTQAQGGDGYLEAMTGSSFYKYMKSYLDVLIMDAAHLAWLQYNFTGTVIGDYYRIPNAHIATLATGTPTDSTNAELREVIYYSYLLQRGAEKIAESGKREMFEGTIIPSVTYEYKTDYDIGDIVSVSNEYGVTANARIVEIIEVVNDSGYSVEPKFEYLEQ